VKVLMTNHSLGERAGSESYLETVSAELRRLGHVVVLFSTRGGESAARFREDGFTVVESVDELPDDVDVVHGQHADTVALVRSRLSSTPLVFVTHSWSISLEDPLTELGAGAFVALNDLTHRRLLSHEAARGGEVVRLTQPVTVSFADGAREPIGPRPGRAVAVSRRMETLPERLRAACAEHGIGFDWLGGPDRQSSDPRAEMRAADIVFAVGRTALEGMADARAVFVVDETSVGGWVRATSYPGLEAGGFTGIGAPMTDHDLVEALSAYDPVLGQEARALVVQHHAAPHHAARLVELYTRVADRPVGSACTPSTPRLVEERFSLEARAVRAEWREAQHLRELEDVRRELEEVRAQRDRFRRQRNRARRALAKAAERGFLKRVRRRR
jgi:hypothetical protein